MPINPDEPYRDPQVPMPHMKQTEPEPSKPMQMDDQQQSKFFFPKDSSSQNGRPDQSMFIDDNDEDSYAYNTESLDENGKKMFVYSRPVHLSSDVSSNDGKFVPGPESPGVSPNMINQGIYRKPLAYDDGREEDRHHEPASLSGQFNQNRPYQTEMSVQQERTMPNHPQDVDRYVERSKNNSPQQYQQSIYPEYSGDQQELHQRPQPPETQSKITIETPYPTMDEQQYHQNQQNNPSTIDYEANMPSGSQHIEYGGFVPIKKPLPTEPSGPVQQNNHPSQNFNGEMMMMNDLQPPHPLKNPNQKPPYEFGSNVEDYREPQVPQLPQQPHISVPSQQEQQNRLPPPPPLQLPNHNKDQRPMPFDEFSRPPPQQPKKFRHNLNYESAYHGPAEYDIEPTPSVLDDPDYLSQQGPKGGQNGFNIGGSSRDPPSIDDHFQQQNQPQLRPQKNPSNRFPSLRPFYGRDAIKKLNEFGINENEFYGTVNKILQKSRGLGNKPNFGMGRQPYIPKMNLYRLPSKNRPRPYQGQKQSFFRNPKPMASEFDFSEYFFYCFL